MGGRSVGGQGRGTGRGNVTVRGGTRDGSRGGNGRGGQGPRGSSTQVYGGSPGGGRVVGRAVPRGSVGRGGSYRGGSRTPRYGYDTHYNSRYGNRYGSRYYYRRPYVSLHRGYGSYPRYVYPRAYGSYFFMPGFSFGVGVGFPVGYGHVGIGFGYSGYRYGYGSYGYGNYVYGPGYGHLSYSHYPTGVADAYTGFLRLRMRPRHAQVFVDGSYVGIVDDFDGVFQRVRIEEGSHQIEVEAPGYAPLQIDVLIVPGEKVTYTGDLLPAP